MNETRQGGFGPLVFFGFTECPVRGQWRDAIKDTAEKIRANR